MYLHRKFFKNPNSSKRDHRVFSFPSHAAMRPAYTDFQWENGLFDFTPLPVSLSIFFFFYIISQRSHCYKSYCIFYFLRVESHSFSTTKRQCPARRRTAARRRSTHTVNTPCVFRGEKRFNTYDKQYGR